MNVGTRRKDGGLCKNNLTLSLVASYVYFYKGQLSSTLLNLCISCVYKRESAPYTD